MHPILRLLPIWAVALIALASVAPCGGRGTEPGGDTPQQDTTRTTTFPGRVTGDRPAPELDGIVGWINADAFTLASLRGKVVLVDFWTYTCVNCIRTFPHLKGWHERYADQGLVIVGVHTPEFRFERDRENVRRAIAQYGIRWSVAQDNDYSTWRAYNNIFWPSKYLIDKDGVLRYHHAGEGAYAETERMIRILLEEAGADLATIESIDPVVDLRSALSEAIPHYDVTAEQPSNPDAEPPRLSNDALDPTFEEAPRAEVTSELYTGYEGACGPSFFSNSDVADPTFCESQDRVVFYSDAREHEVHRLYLQGTWIAGSEKLRHGRATADYEDYLLLRFVAKSVNAVLDPGEGGPIEVALSLDGESLTQENRGQDVTLGSDGRSFVVVDSPRMYRLVEAPSYGVYDLKLSADAEEFAVFTFSFGVYAEGP